MCVLDFGGVGISPAPLSVCLDGKAHGGRERSTTPEAVPLRTETAEKSEGGKQNMKKALAYALSLALLLSLTACNKPQTEQPDTSQPEPEVTANQVETEPEQATVTQLSQTEEQAGVKPFVVDNIVSGDELIAIFQHIYDRSKGTCSNEKDQLVYELGELAYYASFEMDPKKELPKDVLDRYVDWRPADDFVDGGNSYDERFAVTNDTVYATGTVNIREDTSASSTTLGTLNTGESITRTGIGIVGTTAEGWARCELSNGQVVFISSSYLSLEKPATQSTSSTTTTQAQGGGPSGGGPSGSEVIDPSKEIIGWSEEELASFDAFAKAHGMESYTDEEVAPSGEMDPRVHVG